MGLRKILLRPQNGSNKNRWSQFLYVLHTSRDIKHTWNSRADGTILEENRSWFGGLKATTWGRHATIKGGKHEPQSLAYNPAPTSATTISTSLPSPPPTHAETHTQESHTQLSSYNHHEHPPIHSRLRSVDIHHDVVHWHPFMDGIMDTPLPTTWKILNIERYDGTSDSNQHLHTFTMQVNLHFNDDTVMCKVFPTSLKGWCWHATNAFPHDPLTLS